LDKNTPEALTADGFTDIDIDTLSAVLDRDSLRIKESKLFSAVLR
jgi:BTB/POZ domain-containing protein 1/2